MSDQNEPLKVVNHPRRGLLIEDEVGEVAIVNTAGEVAQEGRINARRLVACWNACQGIPTEELETEPNLYALRALAGSAQQMLAACRESLVLLEDRLDLAEISGLEKRHLGTLRGLVDRAPGA